MNVFPPLCLVISVWKAIKHFLIAIPVISPTSFFCCSCSWANLWSKRLQFSPHHVLVGSKSKPDQNKINWLESASDVSPTSALIQSVFNLASLPFPSPPNSTYSHRYLYLHIFIYLLLHSWFSLNNLLHSPFLLYHPLHYLLISWNLFVTVVVRRDAARPTLPGL